MMPLVVILLMASSGAVRKTSDDGTALAIERCKDRFSNREARRGCVTAYMERKKASTTDMAMESASPTLGCTEPNDEMTAAERMKIDRCLHSPETRLNSAWLHEHLSTPVQPCQPASAALVNMSPSARLRCLQLAGEANWTAHGLVDGAPGCGRTWLSTGCARALFAGRDTLFIGNSVIRRQMYTVIDLLAGPSARRLTKGSKPRVLREVVPGGVPHDVGTLADTALLKQEGVLSTRLEQVEGRAWTAQGVQGTRMWDRDGEPSAYHAAQLVTVDLSTGAASRGRTAPRCAAGRTAT